MKIAFWNVGIKHKDAGKEEYSNCIIRIIQGMIQDDFFDAVFLCEVDEELTLDAAIISELAKNDILMINAATKIKSNLSLDLCAIYNSKTTKLNHEKDITYNNLDDGKENTGTTVKVGSAFLLKKANDEESDVTFIISHWPSKQTPAYEFRHKDAAEKLRIETEDYIRGGRQVILMGDYNLSPHEMIHDTNLKSYNNKFYAKRSSLRLYNLSFSFFEQHSSLFTYNGIRDPLGFGTFISRTNRTTEIGCEVFDQAHVSSSFINDGPWLLDEKETKIFTNDIISGLVYGHDIELDHLPISIEINKND